MENATEQRIYELVHEGRYEEARELTRKLIPEAGLSRIEASEIAEYVTTVASFSRAAAPQ